MSVEASVRQALSDLGRRLASRGMSGAMVGSLSARLDAGRFLLTPGGLSFEFLHPERLMLCELRSNKQEANAPAALALHRAVYEGRREINALFWTRPPFTTALSMAGVAPSRCLLPFEVSAIEGEAEPTTKAFTRAVELLRRADALLVERYGVITVGASLEEAFSRVEAIEQCAQITHLTRALSPATLPKHQLDHKIALGSALGLSQSVTECSGCGGCGQPKTSLESEAALSARVAAMFQPSTKEEPPAFTLPPGRRATCGEAWWLEPEKK